MCGKQVRRWYDPCQHHFHRPVRKLPHRRHISSWVRCYYRLPYVSRTLYSSHWMLLTGALCACIGCRGDAAVNATCCSAVSSRAPDDQSLGRPVLLLMPAECIAGYGVYSGKCEPCPVGNFSANGATGDSECDACASGSTTLTNGSTSCNVIVYDRAECGALDMNQPSCGAVARMNAVIQDGALPIKITSSSMGWRYVNNNATFPQVTNWRNPADPYWKKINWYFFGQSDGATATQYEFSKFKSFWVSGC